MGNLWNDTGRGSVKYTAGGGTVSVPLNPPQIPKVTNCYCLLKIREEHM